jgi:ketosteroid isomerase-like protein
MTKKHSVAVLIVLSALIFAAAKAAASKSSSSASPQDQLRPLVEQMEASANAHDTDKFLQLFLHSPALVFAVNGTLIHGYDDLHTQQLKWWNNGNTDVVYTRQAEPEFIVISKDAAIVTLVEASARTKADGTTARNAAAISLVWQRLPEGWRVVYAHESTEH